MMAWGCQVVQGHVGEFTGLVKTELATARQLICHVFPSAI